MPRAHAHADRAARVQPQGGIRNFHGIRKLRGHVARLALAALNPPSSGQQPALVLDYVQFVRERFRRLEDPEAWAGAARAALRTGSRPIHRPLARSRQFMPALFIHALDCQP